MSGTLYLVATPIGNLDDITLRAIKTLSSVDIIAAEDTRVTLKLLNHLSIKKPLISYHEHNKLTRGKEVISLLTEGNNIAVVSDAGMPAISDPGADLVYDALAQGIPVEIIPGVNAALAALVLSGIDTGHFCFEGFLPKEKSRRRKYLAALSEEQRTMIFYESPHRLLNILDEMIQVFGEQRRAAAARELTKIHEEFIRGTLAEIREYFTRIEPRGEFSIVLEGNTPEPEQIEIADLTAELDELLLQGMKRKEASKLLGAKYRIPAKDIYALELPE